MFFRKKINGATVKKHKVSLNLDFNRTQGNFVKQRNIQKVGNSLLSTCGFVDAGYDFDIYRVLCSKEGRLIVSASQGGIISIEGDTVYPLVSDNGNVPVGCVEYRDQIIFSCDSGIYYTTDGKTARKYTTGYYPSFDLLYEQVCGVNDKTFFRILTSEVTPWEDPCLIYSNTDLDAVVALDKIYVLGDTCYALTPNWEDIDMKFVPFCYGIGRVQTESVVRFEKRAIFASTQGLYELKSNGVAPIFTQLNDYVSFDGSVACAYNGKYYISCKRKDGEMTHNDILLVLDVDNEHICAVLNVNAQHISAVDGKLYAVCNNKLYYCAYVDVDSSYVNTVDFDCTNVKYLDKLTLRSRTDADIWINNGTEKRRYRIKGKNTLQRIPLAGSGRVFDVEVQTHSAMQLDSVELTAHSYEV